ncbi:MAG TPA: hypothetical protein VF121_07210 [Thermoanaerobaculia bacterium]|nr:hypothetical protein [Thermoanaerobaculia bacterium]
MDEPRPEERTGQPATLPVTAAAHELLAKLGRAARWFGIKKGLLLLGGAFVVLLKFVWIPAALSRAAATAAEGHGIELEVGDWSANLLDLSGAAHDLRVLAPGPYGKPELIAAEEVVFDLSVWRRLRQGSWVHEVRVRSPRLYLERQLAGHWNWQEALDLRSWSGGPSPPRGGAVLASRRASAGGGERPLLDLRRLVVEDMDVEWVENLPAASGEGLVRSARATLHLDDVALAAEHLRALVDPGAEQEGPGSSRFRFDGRAGSGRLSVRGEGSLLLWREAAPPPAPPFAGASQRLWSPEAVLEVYLEGMGAGAFARLVPQAALVPLEGTMTGYIVFTLKGREIECRTDLLLTGVTYFADPSAPALRGRGQAVQHGLAGFRAEERVTVPCGGDLDDPAYQPLPAVQTAVTVAALRDAPPVVREAALLDQRRFADRVFGASVERMREELGARVGAELAEALAAETAAARDDKEGSVFRRGFRRVKRGAKRLFGRGS